MNNTRHTRTAVENLQHLLTHWDHLRALLDTTQADTTWPPQRPGAAYLHALDQQDAADISAEGQLLAALARAMHHPQELVTIRHESGQLYYACRHCEHVGEGHTHPVREDRDGGQLGDRPVPVRLHVADACRAIEIALCSLADSIATRDAIDPADWHHRDRAHRTAPTAARWLIARYGTGPAVSKLHEAERLRIEGYAREAAARLDRVLGTGRASAVMPGKPCPWCGGDLVLHTEAGAVVSVSCSTGLVDCEAPAQFDIERRARVWSTPVELAGLQRALDKAARERAEAEERARRAEARRAQRAAARERTAA
ncbi:hypothetical protein ACFY40_11505 [Streptomyces sp. NPDC012950]|uniref:hypothetical protein n=1 Tax=Streptomyces sp. NPDC012950 TaxID=3364858 RepID=UPI00368479C4